MSKQVRQGDVLLNPIDFSPVVFQKLDRVKGKLILALGEATGHAHAINDENAEMFRTGERTFLRVTEKPAELVHEEHGTVTVEPGDYEIIMQRQQDARSERQVESRARYD